MYVYTHHIVHTKPQSEDFKNRSKAKVYTIVTVHGPFWDGLQTDAAAAVELQDDQASSKSLVTVTLGHCLGW